MAPPNLPAGDITCTLSIIDTTTNGVWLSRTLISPVRPGHDSLNLPTYSYLIINNNTGEHILFDLGMRKDWWNMTPANLPAVDYTHGLRVDKDVPEILTQGNMGLDKISAAVLSHHHLDHVGNMSLFPKSTKAVVGPGFKAQFASFYPEEPTSPFHAYELEGREVVEIHMDESAMEIGGFKAHNFFGDGSFYILHTPGHTKEHLAGLVRTTADPDTFVLLGGDCCHFMGVMRPSKEFPLPDTFPEEVNLRPVMQTPCSSAPFAVSHRHGPEAAKDVPFYTVPDTEESFYANPVQAQETVEKLRAFDVHPNVLIAIAHDPSLGEVLPFFPNGTFSDWKVKRYKEKVMWNWIKELPRDGKRGMPRLVDGVYREGNKLRGPLTVE